MNNHPPCPECGEQYEEFIPKVSMTGETEEPDEVDCETGLGYYLHETD